VDFNNQLSIIGRHHFIQLAAQHEKRGRNLPRFGIINDEAPIRTFG
jgi:hypothetical protein